MCAYQLHRQVLPVANTQPGPFPQWCSDIGPITTSVGGLLVWTLTARILCCELVHSSVQDGANVAQKEIINVAIGKTRLVFI